MSEIRLYFKSSAIRDDAEFLCLTDMWRAAGSVDTKRPADWLASAQGKGFAEFIQESIAGIDGNIVRAEPGRLGATWAHWQLGMAYAKYLSHEFHAWCNDVVRKVMQGAPVGSADLTAFVSAICQISSRVAKIESNQAALWANVSLGGYIASGRFESLKREWNSLISVEVAIGRWPTPAAARRDIMNELHDVTQWGGKCKPWHQLPAALEPVARAVVKRRMKDAERASRSGRQMSLVKTG